MKITEAQLKILGHDIADKADNYLGLVKLPLPARLAIDGMKTGLEEIRAIARQLVVDISGDDPWE